MKKIIAQYEQDWLASRPIFYNTKTLKVSGNINDVIDFDDIEFHPEGFNNFLDFGYSVFEQTPLKNVKFMRWSSILRIFDDNTYQVEYLPDPVEAWFGKTTKEDDVLEMLRSKIQTWEESVNGEIALPLSGGFDSRLLASMIKDKSRLRCYTYGVSYDQAASFEVVYAKKVAEILHLNWRRVEREDYLKYLDAWNKLFGVSTHSHGMYHIQFYTKMLETYTGAKNFLSGIFGDVWAGNVSMQKIKSKADIIKLGYTHGLNASSKYSLLPHDDELLSGFCKQNLEKLQEHFYQIITTIRLKIILISYLVSVPESFGFSVFAPYLDMESALSMLCLPAKRRKNRQWQRDYFKKAGLDVENMNLRADFRYTAGFEWRQKAGVPPLTHKYFDNLIEKQYLDEINEVNNLIKEKYDSVMPEIVKPAQPDRKVISLIKKISRTLHINKLLRKILVSVGLYKEKLIDVQNSEAKLNAYFTLKPFEYLFK